MTTTVKASVVLREAARIIEQELPRIAGCIAIFYACNRLGAGAERTRARDAAHGLFGALYRGEGNPTYWFGDEFDEEQQNHRITALCLAAAIAESEGD